MSLNQSAEENLRMIRSLMERTKTYRSISVSFGVWAAILSFAAFLLNLVVVSLHHSFSSGSFLALWLGVLVLAALGNTVLLYNDSRKTGSSFPPPALLSATWGMLPAFLVAAVFTGCLAYYELVVTPIIGRDIEVVTIWILCYGLALLSTQHFAPRSIVILGWAFLLSALILKLLLSSVTLFIWIMRGTFSADSILWIPSALMAATFGGFHLLYAASVYASLQRERTAQHPRL